jgi:hypothetical protein
MSQNSLLAIMGGKAVNPIAPSIQPAFSKLTHGSHRFAQETNLS